MIQRRKLGMVIFILAIMISMTSCVSISQATQAPILPSPTNIPPTNPPPPTETVIPTATNPPITPAATETSTIIEPEAGQVNLVELTSFSDEEDYWYFYGLVRNDTDQAIYDIQIEVRLLDSKGAEIYTYTTYTMLSQLAPGETSPFSDFTTQQFTDGSRVQAAVVGYNSTEAITRAVLELRGITLWVDDSNNAYLSGELFNGNSDPAQVYALAATLIDPAGKVVTASYAYYFLGYLEPNETSPFSMQFDTPTGQAASLTNYTIYLDAVTADVTSTYNISLSDTHYDYLDLMNDFHLVGSVTNNDSEALDVSMIAGLYDSDGNCIDANYFYLPISLNPGETFPYDFSLWGVIDYVPEAYDAADHFKVIVDWMSTSEAYSQAYVLKTADDANSFDGDIGTFNGTVINNSGQDLSAAVAIVALYDKASEELIATNYSYVTESLANNATGTYEVYLYLPTDFDPAKVNVIITAIGQ